MHKKEKPAGGRPAGSRRTEKSRGLIISECSRIFPPRQIKFVRSVSSLVDQALSRAEYHDDLAQYHAQQAKKHRAVLHSLQHLIPHYRIQVERATSNEQ